MSSKDSISRKFHIAIIIITTTAISFFAIISIWVNYSNCQKECSELTSTYINEQEQIVKYEVERAVSSIESRLNSSGLPLFEFKELIISQLRELRFPNKGKELGFFFARSYDGIQILSVSLPELEGTDMSKNEDPDGILTHELFMNLVNDKGFGFADYSWYNPISKEIQKKRSYIKSIPELRWYIGAGFWFKDINSVIEAKKVSLIKEVKTYILLTVLIILIAFITILIASVNISKKLKESFNTFSRFFKDAATKHVIVEKKHLYYTEFQGLAESANQMISDRMKAEEDYRIMAHAFQSISDCITVTDFDNNLLYVNEAFLKTYGYDRKDVEDKRMDLFGSSKNPSELHETILKETLKGGWNGELWNTRKNGDEFKISLSTSIIKNNSEEVIALVGISKDITEQKRNELLQSIIHNISHAANIANGLDELIDTIKTQLEQIIDVKNFYVAFYDEVHDTFSSPYMLDEKDDFGSWPAGKTLTSLVYRSGKSKLLTKGDINNLTKLGEVDVVGTLPEVWLGVPLKIKGKPYGVFAVQNYVDKNTYVKKDMEMLEIVSHQMSISIERRKVEDELKIAYEKAKESERLKSAFLATMSHELRTPLNAVIGFSGLINENEPIDKIMNYSAVINRSGRHLLEIVEDIFDVTLLEVGEVQVTKENYPLKALMSSIKELISVEQSSSENQVKIDFILPTYEDEIHIYTDKAKFTQIIINLLKNALKFTQKGKIECGYNKTNENGTPFLKFYVKDTGIGIEADKQQFIFNIFRQADESLTRYYGGTGIGLFVVKKYTELLGGKVELISNVGKGSTFYVTLPYLNPYNDVSKNEAAKIKNGDSMSDKTILIVEDDDESSILLMEILKTYNINCLTAKDGKEAVKICEEKSDIDMVLMDIKMPEMDGFTATEIIKKKNPNLIIVAQTAHAITGDREKALKSGFDDYISKPIIFDDLNKIIQHYIH